MSSKKHENKPSSCQTTLSKFFNTSSQKREKAKCKRERLPLSSSSEHEQVTKKPRISEVPPVASTSTQALSKATTVKLQTFAANKESWNHFTNESEQDLVKLKQTPYFTLPRCKANKKETSDFEMKDFSESSLSLNQDNSDEDIIRSDSPTKLDKFKRTTLHNVGNQKEKQGKKGETILGKPVKYTPLEKQVVELKEKNPDILLFVECGYKYRFFGEDAEIAAKELNIYCHVDHNFMTASIPTHRLHVHLRKLVEKGYKIGVVKQTETAALKAAGDNRSAPFTRNLSAVYTKATLIGPDCEPSDGDTASSSVSGHLMCLYESYSDKKSETHTSIAMVSVQLSTGEIVYDLFEDSKSRTELSTRLSHVDPVEVILSRDVSEVTEKTVKHHAVLKSKTGETIRTELMDAECFNEQNAAGNISCCYSKMNASASCISAIIQLPAPVLCALHALVKYLTDFNLHKLLKVNSLFQKFSEESLYMNLSGKAVENLEVFHNSTNGCSEGSLFWLLNKTSTKFGARLLRRWLSKPLSKKAKIEERLDAVQVLKESTFPFCTQIKDVLIKLPDLDKTLAVIFHRKCSPFDFLTFCQALQRVYQEVEKHQQELNKSTSCSLLKDICNDLIDTLGDVSKWIDIFDKEQARKGCDKSAIFKNAGSFPELRRLKEIIESIFKELDEHKREIRKLLKIPALDYVTVAGTEFLIEVKNVISQLVPSDWVKISATKSVSRYHSPFIIDAMKRLSQSREQLAQEADIAWERFLEEFEHEYPHYKNAVNSLATLDCLFAFADISKQNEYCKPEIVDDVSCLHIEDGRHPIVDVWHAAQKQFVPNHTHLEEEVERCMIITGPNMGGKSSYIKQVALITLMAQIGCYVPASSAKIGVVDAIHTRMGASDELFHGRSTFMVELQEASSVISKATRRSLVVLDELGRGTSTHDGVAIAYATLRYFVEQVKCMTLFVTHYPPVTELATLYPGTVRNYHMSFYVQDDVEDVEDSEIVVECLAFLYQLVPGVATCSYGLNVARLAGISSSLLQKAKKVSKNMQESVQRRREKQEKFIQIVSDGFDISKLQQIMGNHNGKL